MATMTRQERRHSETRREILRAARALVIERGAAQLSVREVARRTGFTPSALYRYFEAGRDEILLEVARGSLDVMAAHLRRVPAGLEFDERFLDLGMAYLDFCREHPQEVALLFDSLTALEGADVDIESDEGLLAPSGVFGIIDETTREGIAKGIIRADSDDDAMAIWHGAWALLHGMALIERMHEHHSDIFRRKARGLLRAYLNGLKTHWQEP